MYIAYICVWRAIFVWSVHSTYMHTSHSTHIHTSFTQDVCMYTYIHAYIDIYIHTYIDICICDIHTYIHTYIRHSRVHIWCTYRFWHAITQAGLNYRGNDHRPEGKVAASTRPTHAIAANWLEMFLVVVKRSIFVVSFLKRQIMTWNVPRCSQKKHICGFLFEGTSYDLKCTSL